VANGTGLERLADQAISNDDHDRALVQSVIDVVRGRMNQRHS
jgi:hypothetical protein